MPARALLLSILLTGLAACSSVQPTRPLPDYLGLTRHELEAELGNQARATRDDGGRIVLTYQLNFGEEADPRAELRAMPAACDQITPNGGEYSRRRYEYCNRPQIDPVRLNAAALVCPVAFTLADNVVTDVRVSGACERSRG
jgi:hypothetical protein